MAPSFILEALRIVNEKRLIVKSENDKVLDLKSDQIITFHCAIPIIRISLILKPQYNSTTTNI